MAIGINLLFGVPLLYGVLITLLDTFLLLYLQRLGMRKLEAFIISLIFVIGLCFLIELYFVKPSIKDVAAGFIPYLPNYAALYIAIGIIGATVMPHNLYLHSALVQTRKFKRDDKSIKKILKLNAIDSTLALNIAFFVNAAILIVAASAFYFSGHRQVASLQDAYQLLTPLLGNRRLASILFAVALIAAGQSSTVTGTLAGQIVMEGYLRLRINPLVRRLITRLLAIIPTVIVILVAGPETVGSLLIFSQVLLSMQLAFAVIPLIIFVSDKAKMGIFVIKPIVKVISWIVAILIVVLNFKLVYESGIDWMNNTNSLLVKILIVGGELALIALLIFTIAYPFIQRKKETNINIHNEINMDVSQLQVKPFEKIALALDYSEKDLKVIQYAMQMAKSDTAFVLIHIVESVSARMMEGQAHDYETIKDQEQLNIYIKLFDDHGYKAYGQLGFKSRTKEIARIVKENHCDLLIMGSHGHKTIKDWLLGETINTVRHMVQIPVFIAR